MNILPLFFIGYSSLRVDFWRLDYIIFIIWHARDVPIPRARCFLSAIPVHSKPIDHILPFVEHQVHLHFLSCQNITVSLFLVLLASTKAFHIFIVLEASLSKPCQTQLFSSIVPIKNDHWHFYYNGYCIYALCIYALCLVSVLAKIKMSSPDWLSSSSSSIMNMGGDYCHFLFSLVIAFCFESFQTELKSFTSLSNARQSGN